MKSLQKQNTKRDTYHSCQGVFVFITEQHFVTRSSRADLDIKINVWREF